MHHVLYPLCAAAAWTAFLYKLRDRRRQAGNPALTAVCVAFLLLAVVFTVSSPSVWEGLDRLVGVPNLSTLVSQGCVVAFSATVQVMLLFWVHPRERAVVKVRRRLLGVAVALAVMTVLFGTTAPREERSTDFVVHYSANPNYALYLVFYVSAFAVGLVDTTRIGWRYARDAPRPWLRRGLRATAVGAAVGLGYCAVRIANVVAPLVGLDMRPWEVLAPLCASVGALLVVIGLTVPAWGPHLSGLPALARRYLDYQRLTPLWRAVALRSSPEVVLDPPVFRALEWLRLRDLDFHLYRRVIEIRDGRLALRPHLDRRVAAVADRLGRAAGLPADDLLAVVEAARLAAAVRDKARGSPPTGDPPADGHEQPGGADLSTEIAWLVRVSRAYRRSPVVRAALAEAR
ncbi:hypothetical protein LX15_003462 [Streptoalloteichus tenebrarius]|uniref:DUF6545 domain-containing protein n=1 Tax=Streptoalloteichus tenebrarius (strain ATCC 17920 / DSM 40477 / JCM 4838 / CBS 697.72 / NBRC 16177 / NCIMB 11028 / NRRL B-12390 / A12253. 1 / ISP 5477) TaxID=1933 RepID=A0ABT1HW58_STRSD|nr:MAB_1171c family putative transporter [Streptoalloteichus tenebrarius]MCP2259756.1 hypothetical protein [Streptoalloteichus tenebrarius]BFF00739.1 hypothetical protein GCM10020241_24140 [Streptoalloteichus tenebrarius]